MVEQGRFCGRAARGNIYMRHKDTNQLNLAPGTQAHVIIGSTECSVLQRAIQNHCDIEERIKIEALNWLRKVTIDHKYTVTRSR